MQAMILAAGEGSRLGDQLGRPKCVREVGGVPLVIHQLRALAAFGISDVVVVVGFEQAQVRDCIGRSVCYVVNDRFGQTNSLYSFLLGQRVVDEDVIVLNSDVYFHPGMLGMLVDGGGSGLLYDTGSGRDDEHMKVHVLDGRLVAMSKTLPMARVSGENVGVLRLSRGCLGAIASVAGSIVARGGERAWLAAAINEVADVHPFACHDVAGWPWVEIDFPMDLHRARAEVLPAVLGARSSAQYAYASAQASAHGSAS